ncbi:hypothetical protein AUR68_06315 [Idiomarina sp. H105]|nr:hypothetical protein AUR68_06315 [Idiomarina sp. H105]
MSLLEYRGYHGTAEASLEDDCMAGTVLHVQDKIVYFGDTVAELRASFEKAVDDYLEFCEEVGKKPEKPFSGTLNVRLGKELHRNVAIKARAKGVSINEYVVRACSDYVKHDGVHKSHVFNHIYNFETEKRSQVENRVIEPKKLTSDQGGSGWKSQKPQLKVL